MSYCTWHNYGYGIADFNSVNWNKLEELIKSEPCLHDILDLLTDEYNNNANNYSCFQDFLKDEDIVSDIIESTYIGSVPLLILQKVIEFKHNIRLAVVDDFNCKCFLILCEGSPWEYNEVERSLTKEMLSEILKQYCVKIDGEFKFDHWSIENGG